MSNLRKSILHRTNWQSLRKRGGEKRIRETTLNNSVFMLRIFSILIKSISPIVDLGVGEISVVDFTVIFTVELVGESLKKILAQYEAT